MTGFRVAYGGAQQLYGVRPDLTILGKIIGGGMPVGAVAGPAAIMDNLAPQGKVYQAGTLSGSPAAMAAGIATLNALRDGQVYETIEQHASQLEQGLREAAERAGLTGRVCINRVASMLCCFFTPGPVTDYASATASDTRAFSAYFNAMLEAGIYLPPSQFEAMFVSSVHSDMDIADTVKAARTAFAAASNVM